MFCIYYTGPNDSFHTAAVRDYGSALLPAIRLVKEEMPIPVLLGISMEDCKNLLGETVQKYSYQGRTEEIEYKGPDGAITVVPIHGRIVFVGLHFSAPPDNLLDLLQNVSGSSDWVEDESKTSRITDQFPGYISDAPAFKYFESGDGRYYAMAKVGFLKVSPYIVTILASDFQAQLLELPSKYDQIARPPQQPFFFYGSRRFGAEIGKSGEFEHFVGHSDELVIQRRPAKGTLHQLVNLDLRDPRLGLSVPGLSRLPLVYSFQFESGRVEYDVLADNQIRVTHLNEETFQADFLYADYPRTFPKTGCSLTKPEVSTLESFAADVWQGIRESEKDKFICVVPPSPLFDVHLWRPDDHGDDIHVKFFFDPLSRHVAAYNECD